MEKVLIKKEYLERLRKRAKKIQDILTKDKYTLLELSSEISLLIGQISASSLLEKYGEVK